MTYLFVGLVIGLLVGLAIGFMLGRQGSSSSSGKVAPRSAAVDTGTPLLDSLLGGDAPPAQGAVATKPAPSRVATLHQNLRVKFQYDEDAIQRAIDFEREKFPAAGEEELLEAAIDRWERQNR